MEVTEVVFEKLKMYPDINWNGTKIQSYKVFNFEQIGHFSCLIPVFNWQSLKISVKVSAPVMSLPCLVKIIPAYLGL